MRLTHLGHACLLVEVAGKRILLDPGNFSNDLESQSDLDAILMTHQHKDHADPDRLPAVVSRNPEALLAAEPQTAAALAEQTGGAVAPSALAAEDVVKVGDVEVRPVGELHAVNHEWTPRVGNLGLVLSSPGEPTLFHPGDAYDAEPGRVDVLALPLNAPWTNMADTLAFVRRLSPRVAVPIHDALLSEAGRGLYLNHVGSFGPDEMQVRDLADGKQADFAADPS